MSLEFTCPKCGGSSMEEVMADVTVVSECYFDGNDNFEYDEQTNDGGHVVRYQCGNCNCDYVIINEGGVMDEEVLAEILREMNSKVKPESKGDPVSHSELVQRIADAHEALHGEELTGLWNGMFPNNPVTYKGDSLYEWDEENG